MSLEDGVKCALLSLDDTMRSNLSVGPPLHIMAYAADSLASAGPVRIAAAEPAFQRLRNEWASGLRTLFAGLPGPWPEE
jgi:putative proteasome-type protease